jgi:hypothetical protein
LDTKLPVDGVEAGGERRFRTQKLPSRGLGRVGG